MPAHPSLLALIVLACALVGVLPAAAAPVASGPPVVQAGSRPATAAAPTPSSPGPAPATSPTPATAPTAPTAGDDAELSVAVTSIAPGVVRPTDELVVHARIHNETAEPLDSPAAHLLVNRFMLSTRGALQQWASAPRDGSAGSRVATTTLAGPLAPGASVDVELRVPAGRLGLSAAETAWGPRGLSVEVVDGGLRAGIHRTFVLWQPVEPTTPPTRVSVLVPLTGGPVDPTVVPEPADDAQPADPADPAPQPGAPTEADEPATDEPVTTGTAPDAPTSPGDDGAAAGLGAPSEEELDRLEDVVAATGGQPRVLWAADPMLVAAARSPAASARAQRWAEVLTAAAAGREVVALPARDPDLAALAHGDGEGIAAEAYERARGTSDALFGPEARAELAWPADPVPDGATVGLAAQLGATAVVVGGDGLEPERLTYTPSGRATVPTAAGEVAALVADPVLSGELGAPSDVTPATAAQRLLAESAVIARERPSEQRHLLVTAPRGWAPRPAVARAQLAALATAPWVELSGLSGPSGLIEAADPGVLRSALPERDVAATEISPGSVAALVTAREQLSAFADVVADPTRFLAGADDAVLAPTSVAWRVDPVQRRQVVDGVVADLAARRSGVSTVPGSDLYLGSESGRFPLELRNDLDQDVTVQVAVDPASPALVVEGTPTVTIAARSQTQLRVPFRAVGNGDVRVAVTLLAPSGAPLGPAQELTVRVRADWENVGTGVVGVLLGLALVIGLIRTIRRGQTSTRGAGGTPVSEIARQTRDPT